MEKLKFLIGCLLSLFLGLASYLTFVSTIFILDTKDSIQRAKPALTQTLGNIQHASASLEASSKAVQKVSEAEANLLLNEKTAEKIGVLVRKADNVARIIDHVEDITKQVDKETIPSTTEVLKNGTKVLQSADNVLVTADKNLDKVSDIAIKDLQDLSQLLTSPEIASTLKNLSETSSEVKNICKNLDITTQDLNKSLPEILKEVREILKHIDDGTEQTSLFIRGFNKPLTKKQKLIKAAIQILVIAAPIIARR